MKRNECYDDEQVVDDSVKSCPDCDRPNQFGELCWQCTRDRQMDEAERWPSYMDGW